MALKPCIECGTQISTQAKTCPRCGAKNSRINKFFAYIIIIGVVITVIASIFSSVNDNDKINNTSVDEYDALVTAHSFVEDKLKAPATAEFPTIKNTVIKKTENIWELSSYVDAQNSFGATIRTNWYVKMEYKLGNKTFYLIDINLWE